MTKDLYFYLNGGMAVVAFAGMTPSWLAGDGWAQFSGLPAG
ncbi:MAG: hypothetical protein P0Y58_18400 [Candidatus Pseudomonas phytovorans]|uniref:Uncharacterized protein n=1 Tax=Candidatus Pseudomonas phytovorans TaxID=3121377 RepID=A0AAJ5WEH0_9PSED|nr:hypothetical protein [Pseudomonas sp.]WEK28876.1 MAG: hypothetical protein P0Y58_18400 [Pseudomonas sp.]